MTISTFIGVFSAVNYRADNILKTNDIIAVVAIGENSEPEGLINQSINQSLLRQKAAI